MTYRTLALGLLLAACTAQEPAAQNAEMPQESDAAQPAERPNAQPDVTAPTDIAEEPAATPTESVSACLVQDGERIPANRLKAIGTEPFWGARIEGRCVAYSTPEDIDGTRIWTQFSGTAENGTWTGYFDDQHFVLRTRPQPGCSDGMSDNRYPIAVSLTVRGEERTGCAEPL